MAKWETPSVVQMSVYRTDNNGGGWSTAPTFAISVANCGAGQYYTGQANAPTPGSFCVTASPGYYCPYGAILSDCGQCPGSSYSAAGATACTACPAGTFSLGVGATSASACVSCAAGMFFFFFGCTFDGHVSCLVTC